jgi:hypothetical protein
LTSGDTVSGQQRPGWPVIDRLREIGHRQRHRNAQQRTGSHVKENAFGIHARIGQLDEVRLQTPCDQHTNRQHEPQPVLLGRAARVEVEQRQRTHGQHDPGHAHAARTLMQEQEREHDRDDGRQ